MREPVLSGLSPCGSQIGPVLMTGNGIGRILYGIPGQVNTGAQIVIFSNNPQSLIKAVNLLEDILADRQIRCGESTPSHQKFIELLGFGKSFEGEQEMKLIKQCIGPIAYQSTGNRSDLWVFEGRDESGQPVRIRNAIRVRETNNAPTGMSNT